MEKVDPFATVGTLDDDDHRARRRDGARAAQGRTRSPEAAAGRSTTIDLKTGEAARAVAAVGVRPRRPALPSLRHAHRGRAPGHGAAANHVLVPELPGPRGRSAGGQGQGQGQGRLEGLIAVCEQYVAVSATPFRLDALWPFTERLERFGIAGFGWGATWLATRSERCARTATSARSATTRAGRTSARSRRARCSCTCAGRRSSRRSACRTRSRSMTRTGAIAFSHNGDLEHHQAYRARYREAGRLFGQGGHGGRRTLAGGPLVGGRHRAGRALEAARHLRRPRQPRRPDAGLARAHHYAGNDENPVFTFRIGDIRPRLHRDVLARSVGVQVRRPRGDEPQLVPFEQTATSEPASVARA